MHGVLNYYCNYLMSALKQSLFQVPDRSVKVNIKTQNLIIGRITLTTSTLVKLSVKAGSLLPGDSHQSLLFSFVARAAHTIHLTLNSYR